MVRGADRDRLRTGDGAVPKSILAAAEWAGFWGGRGVCPDELAIWQDWQFFGLPPEGGGQADQPAGLLKRIRALLDVVEAVQVYKREGGGDAGNWAAWKNAHPSEARIIGAIKQLRRDYHE